MKQDNSYHHLNENVGININNNNNNQLPSQFVLVQGEPYLAHPQQFFQPVYNLQSVNQTQTKEFPSTNPVPLPSGVNFLQIEEDEEKKINSTPQTLEEKILSRDSQVDISKWFNQSFQVYKQHWIPFTLLAVSLYLVSAAVFLIQNWVLWILLRNFVWLPLHFGIFIAVSNKLRSRGIDGILKYDHLLSGYFCILPLVFISIIESVLLIIGFVFCILPGLYLMVALSFTIPVFLEYHDLNVGILSAMKISIQVINKHFVAILAFNLVNWFMLLFGTIIFIFFPIIYPIYCLNILFAFGDLFGLNPIRKQINTCVIC